jgi:hypothetical protein
MNEIRNCDDIDALREGLESALRQKMISVINEAVKRGMAGNHREYNTAVHFKDQDLPVTLKNDTSRKGNTYFRAGKIYYISSFEGNKPSTMQILDAVEIMGLVVEKFNSAANKDLDRIAEAKAKLEAMKI